MYDSMSQDTIIKRAKPLNPNKGKMLIFNSIPRYLKSFTSKDC